MDENENPTSIEAGAAGAPEGAFEQPTTDDIQAMYDDLGIKSPAPTEKPKGRPKTANVRAKDDTKNGAGDTDSGAEKDDADKGESKNAPNSSKDGDSGDDSDSKGAKKRKDSTEVSDKSEKADEGVRDDKSGGEEHSERGSKEDADAGDGGTGQDADESGDEEEAGKDSEGKRPGKSNPEVERRFQKLTSEVRERDQLIEELEKEIQTIQRKQQEAQVSQEDPEYTIDDFRKVRDEDGNILDLDNEQAELAWRRWQDGYNQRKAERDARVSRDEALHQSQREAAEHLMRSSVAAYDTLVGIYENTPELNVESPQFDQEFSDQVMPIIEDAVIYQKGTEPGNTSGQKPVIVGLKVDPNRIISAMNAIRHSKRRIPLNGMQDTVESSSNTRVSHSRSSDPTVKAANDLYKELGITKRL